MFCFLIFPLLSRNNYIPRSAFLMTWLLWLALCAPFSLILKSSKMSEVVLAIKEDTTVCSSLCIFFSPLPTHLFGYDIFVGWIHSYFNALSCKQYVLCACSKRGVPVENNRWSMIVLDNWGPATDPWWSDAAAFPSLGIKPAPQLSPTGSAHNRQPTGGRDKKTRTNNFWLSREGLLAALH